MSFEKVSCDSELSDLVIWTMYYIQFVSSDFLF